MLKTKLTAFESDLREVITMFGKDDDIVHLFSENERKVVNTVVVGGKSYAYGNLLPENLTDIERKRLIKRYAKLSLYKALSAFYNVTYPWGSLTGIRPTKLAYSEIEKEGDFKEFFINTMKVSEEKTLLTQKVINAQKGIYVKDDDNTDFFVFIPFCPSRCTYCSFISSDVKSAQKLVEPYVETLIREIKESKKYVKKLRSIYIGGGTPVALSDENLERVLSELDSINTCVEYTVEAGRPDAITESNLKILKAHNVTRICINPQTFNAETLKRIGRKHTPEETIEKYLMAKKDFSVNMDLIAGLSGETAEDFYKTLEKAIELSPDAITVHTLCLKRGSSLSENTERLFGEEVEKMVAYAHKRLQETLYTPYYLYRQKYQAGNLENVGYCKEGKQCVYNIDVMEEIANNVACGANAISKMVYNGGERIERYASPKDVKTYIEKIDAIIKGKDKLFG